MPDDFQIAYVMFQEDYMAYPDFSDRTLSQLISLNGRTAVVTGAGAGLGRAIAQRLAEAGATLVVGDLDEASARETVESLQAETGRKHRSAFVDVRDHASITALADKAVSETGRLNIWVNNAGIYPGGEVLNLTDESWDKVLDINLRGTFFGAREAALRMESNHGVIINLSSTAGFDCTDALNPAHYVASKHGVIGLTKSLAVELGRKGIRTVGVAPTMTETKGVAFMRGISDGVNAALDTYGRGLPLGRSARPDDIARVVLFLASDLAGFVNGAVVPVDGGDLAR